MSDVMDKERRAELRKSAEWELENGRGPKWTAGRQACEILELLKALDAMEAERDEALATVAEMVPRLTAVVERMRISHRASTSNPSAFRSTLTEDIAELANITQALTIMEATDD